MSGNQNQLFIIIILLLNTDIPSINNVPADKFSFQFCAHSLLANTDGFEQLKCSSTLLNSY